MFGSGCKNATDEWLRTSEEISRFRLPDAYHLYVIRLQSAGLDIDRNGMFQALRQKGIGVNVHYIPVHLHPFYRKQFGTRPGLFRLKERADKKSSKKPILLKIAPDLSNEQIDDIVDVVNHAGLDGIIATNTTISKKNLKSDQGRINDIGQGGLSGKPLREVSTSIIRYLREKLGPDFPIIGVGGILSAVDALEKIEAGADLVQIFTGFIYEGPGLIKQINKAILAQR